MLQNYKFLNFGLMCVVMVKSVLSRVAKVSICVFFVFGGLVCSSFGPGPNEQQLLSWSNTCLSQCFDPSSEAKIKKWDVQLTPEGFVRMRKTYNNGKQEYYSLYLKRLENLDYLGTDYTGMLQLKAIADDIIVQTYDDPKGNVDSMSTVLNIPVKNMEPQRLDSLRTALFFFKDK